MINHTLIVSLVDTDTNRIMADEGDKAGEGSQYIWLSMSCENFFPPLREKNNCKKVSVYTYVNLNYTDLNINQSVRVSHELNNNSDFRIYTGKLQFTKLAQHGDLACISRVGERDYQIKIIPQNSPAYNALNGYATVSVGNRGKRIGYIANNIFWGIV